MKTINFLLSIQISSKTTKMYDNLITMNDIDVKRSEKMKEKVRYVLTLKQFVGNLEAQI